MLPVNPSLSGPSRASFSWTREILISACLGRRTSLTGLLPGTRPGFAQRSCIIAVARCLSEEFPGSNSRRTGTILATPSILSEKNVLAKRNFPVRRNPRHLLRNRPYLTRTPLQCQPPNCRLAYGHKDRLTFHRHYKSTQSIQGGPVSTWAPT